MPDGTVCHLTDDKAPKRVQKVRSFVFFSPPHCSTRMDLRPHASHPPFSFPIFKILFSLHLFKKVFLGFRHVLTNVQKNPNSELNPTIPAVSVPPIAAPEQEADPAVTSTSTLEESASVLPAETQATPAIEDANTPVQVAEFVISPEDSSRLVEYVGESFKDEIIAFHQKILSKPHAKAASFGSIFSGVIGDKMTRGGIHALVRRVFDQKLETMSNEENRIKFFAAAKGPAQGKNFRSEGPEQRQPAQLKGKLGWEERGGQHLHFTLYKENKDTMEIVSFLAKSLKTKPSDFAFAGTKDRRAATVQRVSVFKQTAERVAPLNRQLRNARIGNFTYEKQRLELGELAGNEFSITLRDCHFGDEEKLDETAKVQLATDVVDKAVTNLQKNGFINYFGLQRFGTFETGTDTVGKLILQGNFQGAVEAILTYNESTLDSAPEDKIGRDDLNRAKAIHKFKTTGRAHEAVEMLSRRFGAETAIIRHLGGRNTGNDYLGALLKISRNLRTMYVHAYQSFVWNMVASERWSRYGSTVVAGDLVIIDRRAEKLAALDEVDENGEVVIHPAGEEVAVSHDDIFERARPLTAEEASSGRYTIFDIVLPMPGYDIEYPNNEIGNFYKDFMGSEAGGGLDPADMRRKQRDFSLSGSYRNFMAAIGKDFSFEVKTYKDAVEQLVETDWEKLQKTRSHKENETGFDAPQNEAYRNGRSQNARGRGGRNNNWARDSRSGRDQAVEASAASAELEPAVDAMDIDKATPGVVPVSDTTTDAISLASTENPNGGVVASHTASAISVEPQVPRLAVIVKFSLKSSQYATVALRELMQGVKSYKPDYNNGR
jgi:tRNA pseudouridine13 synthase